MPGTEDPIDDNVLQYIQENKLKTHEQEELWRIAAILKKIVGNPPDFESVSLQLIRYHYFNKISSTGKKMLQEKFKIEKKPSCKTLESGMHGIMILAQHFALNNLIVIMCVIREFLLLVTMPKLVEFPTELPRSEL